MSNPTPTTEVRPTAFLGGIVRYYSWGGNIIGPATIYCNGREWQPGVTWLWTFFGFGVAQYHRRDGEGHLIVNATRNSLVRGTVLGFFRVQFH